MSQVDFVQIEKRYQASVPVIHRANLSVAAGQFCVFVGPSGCGKSTLLRMVAGLEDITSGELRIEGQRVNALPPAQRGVAMVFQSYALYPHMTVQENMAFGLRVKGASRAQIQAKVLEAAEILQLTPLLDRLPKALSGGQRQRVAIGRAIVKQPRVFLFDEPLSNLDAALRVQTRLEIARLHQRTPQASMIYVTHDQVEAMTLADQIVLLHSGELTQRLGSVAQAGSPLMLYHRPASRFVAEFIGSPKMNVLPGRLRYGDATRAEIQVGERVVVAAVNAQHLRPGQEVGVGLRPEHAGAIRDDVPMVAREPVLNLGLHMSSEQTLTGTLMHIERLGESSLLYLDIGPGMPLLTAKAIGEAPWQTGARIAVTAAATHLHVFASDGMACQRVAPLPV